MSDIIKESEKLLEFYRSRRTYRNYTSQEVPREVVENCIKIAGTAPSGANMQPWTFVLVESKALKAKLHEQAKITEEEFYKKINPEWDECLKKFELDNSKPFLEEAPYLVVVFLQRYGLDENGNKVKHYYTMESVNIAIGFFISAIYRLGLATLTYTPSPMSFLNDLLERPENERAIMVLPVGYPSPDYKLPDITKKSADEIMVIK